MSNKMIIDASHPEETRVVVLRGNKVEEFDFESATKKPLRGNIYLAKVTRVEPSLQAAFVDYGGNRHGFLAFSEIHPDYYQIPVADRQALLEEEARSHREEDEESYNERRSRRRRTRSPEAARSSQDETLSEPQIDLLAEQSDAEDERAPVAADPDDAELDEAENAPEELGGRSEDELRDEDAAEEAAEAAEAEAAEPLPIDAPATEQEDSRETEEDSSPDTRLDTPTPSAPFSDADGFASVDSDEPVEEMAPRLELGQPPVREGLSRDEDGPTLSIERQAALDERHEEADESGGVEIDDVSHEDHGSEVTTIGGGHEGDEPVRVARSRADDEGEPVEMIGGDAMDETPRRVQRPRRHYKIQEVIKRRQVLLVQVVKEERGNKGAALTTYLSLAGRYSVLMPNTARGGGISRKITNAQDRSRLKSIAEDLDVPEGMGVILRTAGASRTKPEVKRDFEYLLRMWETVRETTLASTAPTLVYEEGSLIKRAIRDLYTKEIDEIMVAGEAGYKEAKGFMRLLMPDSSRIVVPHRETQPVFAKAGVEAQLDAMFSNQVTLRSGGYIVINQTEALVAIDVNSGRSTREHNIEDTALRTNLEAADEVARQLRLRDLAGLIVVDFIDMEEGRNNRAVERRMKDALKNDRARIQVGRISHFGLLEMSRQRIRTGVLEGSTVACPHCMGAGVVRSTSSLALHVLRVLEDSLIRNAQYDLIVRARTSVALYILNHKRAHLRELENRFGVAILVEAEEHLAQGTHHALERGEPARGIRAPEPEPTHRPGYGDLPDEEFASEPPVESDEEETETAADESADSSEEDDRLEAGEGSGDDNDRRRRRRRRRRRGGERSGEETVAADAPQPTDDGLQLMAEIGGDFQPPQPASDDEGGRGNGARRRRSRRGRRDRFGPRVGEGAEGAEAGAAAGEEVSETAPQSYEPAMTFDAPATSIAEALEPPLPGEIAPVTPAPEAAPEPVAAAEPPSPVQAPEPEPEPEEPPRPRRTGWWQRAKSTLVGE